MTSVEHYSATRPGPAPAPCPPTSMIGRITLIMDLFADNPAQRFSLEEVSRRTGLPRSSTHRVLEQMSNLQWVNRYPSGYGLGTRVRGLDVRVGTTGALRSAAAPILHELAMLTGMVTHLAVLDWAEIVYLDKVGGRHAADVPSRVGGRAPAHCTALGKAMLALLPPEQVDARLAGRLDAPTRHTMADPGSLHHELGRIRLRKGLTFERGECFPHIGCVAVGIPGPEGPIGALSLVGGVKAPLERVAPLVVDAARRAARDMTAVADVVRAGEPRLELVRRQGEPVRTG
ncbi:IclR family transcriptional regulator [Pseudonocardia xishanensis]|uniref:IclR family transcriptional regulator n=1 Tax=Pseudonocardia xishanensis TaxID=630995 RepID=A0ABP8RRJ3_9PSEU